MIMHIQTQESGVKAEEKNEEGTRTAGGDSMRS